MLRGSRLFIGSSMRANIFLGVLLVPRRVEKRNWNVIETSFSRFPPSALPDGDDDP